MNLIVSAPIWLCILLILVLLAAAIEDAIRLRISNLTCALVLVGAIIAACVHGISFSLWQNVVVCIAILVIGMPAFAAGWFGGGDVKLLAAIGLWLNVSAAVALIATVLIAGGIIAAIYIGTRSWIAARKGTPRRHGKVPYGLAIVTGAFLLFTVQLSQRPASSLPDQLRTLPSLQR